MATTTPDGIYYPISTTQIAPLETQFSTLATSVQTALTARKQITVATASALGALTLATYPGFLAYVTANGSLWYNTGTKWQLVNQPTVASSSARDALYSGLATLTQGDVVFRNDLGYIERYYGLYNASTNPGGLSVAGWYRDLGRGQRALLGSGYKNYSTGGNNMGTVYADLAGMTTTVTTSGLPVMITTTITIRNAASGSPRNATFRLFDGATQLTEVGPVPVSYQTTLDNTTVTFYHQYTPTAASRTIKVQGITATGAAVQFISGEIKVEELYQ